MLIHNAVKEAVEQDAVIYRKSAHQKCTDIDAVIKPTNSYNTCLLIVVENGKANKSSRHWNPTADDLMADDWEVLRDKF